MGYRTVAIAGEMPNGLQDCAGLAVRHGGRAVERSRQERREGERDFKRSSLLVCLCALPMYTYLPVPGALSGYSSLYCLERTVLAVPNLCCFQRLALLLMFLGIEARSRLRRLRCHSS